MKHKSLLELIAASEEVLPDTALRVSCEQARADLNLYKKSLDVLFYSHNSIITHRDLILGIKESIITAGDPSITNPPHCYLQALGDLKIAGPAVISAHQYIDKLVKNTQEYRSEPALKNHPCFKMLDDVQRHAADEARAFVEVLTDSFEIIKKRNSEGKTPDRELKCMYSFVQHARGYLMQLPKNVRKSGNSERDRDYWLKESQKLLDKLGTL